MTVDPEPVLADLYRSEREASLADAQNPAVADERRDWDAALADGIDY